MQPRTLVTRFLARSAGCISLVLTIGSLLAALSAPVCFGAEPAPPAGAASPEVLERLENLEKKMDAPSLWKTLGFKISGFVDVAYTQNFNNPDSNLNQAHIFDTNANAFMPHLAQIMLERPADAGGSLLDRAGFRVRLNYGLDSRVIRARTNYQVGTSNDELDFQELYAEYIFPIGNGLKVQFGKMNTLIGYEVINSWENVNFSRSFMFGTGQAFTTTGLRFTYTFNPMVLASFGVVNGWDNVDDNNRGKTIEYLVALTPSEKFGISWYGSYGPEQANRNYGDTFTSPLPGTTTATGPTPTGGAVGDPSAKRFANGLIITMKPTDKDTVVLEPYYVNESNNPARAVNPSLPANARWNGVAGYLIHDFDERWSFRFRGEIYEDAGGSRLCTGTWNTGGGTNTCAGATNTTPAFPVAQTVWELTPTLQFKPVPPLITRVEFRYDKSNKNPFLYGSRATNHQETLSFEVMYVF
ncbi:MAG: outer membrane beta-barrel protein [Nitrospira sp.]|nr:outer membrane beta-barrel protein [Nitrospira sp.]